MKYLTAIALSLLIALHAQVDEDCAYLLAVPSRQVPVVASDRAFQAYAEDLLDRTILEMEDLLSYRRESQKW